MPISNDEENKEDDIEYDYVIKTDKHDVMEIHVLQHKEHHEALAFNTWYHRYTEFYVNLKNGVDIKDLENEEVLDLDDDERIVDVEEGFCDGTIDYTDWVFSENCPSELSEQIKEEYAYWFDEVLELGFEETHVYYAIKKGFRILPYSERTVQE